MTSDFRQRAQRRWEPPHFFWRTESSDRDLVILDGGEHLVACWTDVVSGRREVVRVETLPRPAGGVQGITPDVLDALVAADRAVTSLGPPQRVSAALLRAIPVALVLKERTRFSAATSDPLVDSPAVDGGVSIPDEVFDVLNSVESLEYLFDSIRYVTALEDGRSPRQVIAKARHIEPVSADRRIARARQLGFLSAAQPRVAGGELTQLALQAIAIVGPLMKGERDG